VGCACNCNAIEHEQTNSPNASDRIMDFFVPEKIASPSS
jgi:hypothetical protein